MAHAERVAGQVGEVREDGRHAAAHAVPRDRETARAAAREGAEAAVARADLAEEYLELLGEDRREADLLAVEARDGRDGRHVARVAAAEDLVQVGAVEGQQAVVPV